MRFLLESKDAGSDKKAWDSKVAHSEGIALAMHDVCLDYYSVFSDSENNELLSKFNKVWSQIEGGLWELGDSAQWEIQGCSFFVSAIAFTKH